MFSRSWRRYSPGAKSKWRVSPAAYVTSRVEPSVDMLEAVPRAESRPEIVERVPVGTEALTGFEFDAPDSRTRSSVDRSFEPTHGISRIGDKVRSHRVRPTLETSGAHHSRQSAGVYWVLGDQSTPHLGLPWAIGAVFSRWVIVPRL